MIVKFKNMKHYNSVGIVFKYDNKILLVRKSGTNEWSYPKGKVKDGEDHKEAAIREVYEEIGIELPSDFLDHVEEKQLETVVKNKSIKRYWFFHYDLNEYEFHKYFQELVIPKYKLQLEEVDMAMFVSPKKAKKLLSKKIADILL